MSFIAVFITVSGEEEALRIARSLVERRLAACCNLLGGVRSIYRWQERVEDAIEVLLVVKTRRECFSALQVEVTRLHSYSVPEIVALPIEALSESYRLWLQDSTATE
jgi:periplasmic divalent cation tolerance protein